MLVFREEDQYLWFFSFLVTNGKHPRLSFPQVLLKLYLASQTFTGVCSLIDCLSNSAPKKIIDYGCLLLLTQLKFYIMKK